MKDITRFLCPYDDIVIGEDFNSRKNMDPVKLQELANSIDANGLIQPIVVREGGPARTDPSKRKFFLVAGERRYRAIALIRKNNPAKFVTVEVKLVKGNSQENAIKNLIENLQREQLDPLEEAEAMKRFMEHYKVNQAQLAKHVGKSEPYISQRLSLLKNIAPEVKDKIERGELSPTHAREMLTLPKEKQKEVLAEVEAKKKAGQKVSVQDVKEAADRHKEELGIKREKGKKKPPAQTFDDEKVSMAKDIYEGQKLDVRPKTAFLEQLGALAKRVERAASDESKQSAKSKIAALEWALGVRDSL